MTAVQSAWHIDHIEDLHELGAELDIAITPAIVALSIITAHTARGARGKPQVIIITQEEAANMIGVSERSIGALYGKLVALGYLAKQRSGRYILGSYWDRMAADHAVQFAGIQHREDAGELKPESPPKPQRNRWRIDLDASTPDDTLPEFRAALKPLPGFVSVRAYGPGHMLLTAEWRDLHPDAEAWFTALSATAVPLGPAVK